MKIIKCDCAKVYKATLTHPDTSPLFLQFAVAINDSDFKDNQIIDDDIINEIIKECRANHSYFHTIEISVDHVYNGNVRTITFSPVSLF